MQELEEGKTHEDLWNAAQLQLVGNELALLALPRDPAVAFHGSCRRSCFLLPFFLLVGEMAVVFRRPAVFELFCCGSTRRCCPVTCLLVFSGLKYIYIYFFFTDSWLLASTFLMPPHPCCLLR